MAQNGFVTQASIDANSISQDDFHLLQTLAHPSSTIDSSNFGDYLPNQQQHFSLGASDFVGDNLLLNTSDNLAHGMEWKGASFVNTQYPANESYFNAGFPAIDTQNDRQAAYIDAANLHIWNPQFEPAHMANLKSEESPAPFMMNHDSSDRVVAGHPSPFYSPQSTRDLSHLSRSPTFDNPSPCTAEKTLYRLSDDGEDDIDVGPITFSDEAEEPYAKLIYKALMAAPNHSMVLQDIYQWFLNNTLKGNATTSGWRNSIRHNLSMNAAFLKTERLPTGNESKKVSEWVLEPSAVRNGVSPTTRYRKKMDNGSKSKHHSRARAGASRKGSMRSAAIKSQRMRGTVDTRRRSHQLTAHRIERHNSPLSTMQPQIEHRHMSPATPSSMGTASSPYFAAYKSYDDPIEPAELSFGAVQGFYHESIHPVYHDGLLRYGEQASYGWAGY